MTTANPNVAQGAKDIQAGLTKHAVTLSDFWRTIFCSLGQNIPSPFQPIRLGEEPKGSSPSRITKSMDFPSAGMPSAEARDSGMARMKSLASAKKTSGVPHRETIFRPSIFSPRLPLLARQYLSIRCRRRSRRLWQ